MSRSSTIYAFEIDATHPFLMDGMYGMDEENNFSDHKTADLPIKYQHLQPYEEKADFNTLPTVRENIDPKVQSIEITIDDLHGNALKLIYFLIREGILELQNDSDYKELVRIHRLKPDELKKSDLSSFNTILSKASINHLGTVRLCNSVSNDYFTLKIIEKLRFNEVLLEIMLSNNIIEFLVACKNPNDSKYEATYFSSQTAIPREEILEISKNYYPDCIKALGYTLSTDGKSITIHSHATIGINTIQHLANEYNIEFNDSSATTLAMTIDGINDYTKNLIINNEFSTIFDGRAILLGYDSATMEQDIHPIEILDWHKNHPNKTIQRPQQHNSYNIEYSNGYRANNTPGENIDRDVETYNITRSICPPRPLNETYRLISKLRNEADQDHHSDSLKDAGLNVAKEASALAMTITTRGELTALNKYLIMSINTFTNLTDSTASTASRLRKYAKEAKGKPNNWKKFMGALSILAGVALICIGALGTPFTGGASLVAGMCIGGSLLTAGGAALFYHGRQKGISKALENLADEAEKPSP